MIPGVSSPTLIEFRSTLDWNDLTALLIVEPDPESWMPTAQALGQADLILDDLGAAFGSQVSFSPSLWLGAANDDEGLFGAEGRFTSIQLLGPLAKEGEIWDYLRDLVTGIARRQPYTVFGVMGATREAEVQRVAALVAGCGLRVVVLEALCLSSTLFYDVDALMAEADRLWMARRVLMGEEDNALSVESDDPV